ncbi:MAG: vitamin K epoxide reductase family protein [Solirubrobacteraceae bacterium]
MSSRAVRTTMIVLAVIGLGIASYVTYVHYAGIKPACTAGESCTKVQTSVYSELDGIPVALMGLIGYIAILASLLIPESETSRFATLILTLGGFGFSAYLTYRELFSIHAICEWCVTSAGVMTILMLLSVWRFLRGGRPAYQSPRSGALENQSAAQVSPN